MLILKNLSFILPQKRYFENFNVNVNDHDRIAIIGRNGAGKTTLLNIITEHIHKDEYFLIPQLINEYDNLSGGERFLKKFNDAKQSNCRYLLLDEPTNHLDERNKKWIIKNINDFNGTVIFVSHDSELIRHCAKVLWHLHDEQILIFNGNYDDYITENKRQKDKLFDQVNSLKKQQKDLVVKQQKEQENYVHKKAMGKKNAKNKKYVKAVSIQNRRNAEISHGKNVKNLNSVKQDLYSQISDLYLPEEIKFNFDFVSLPNRSTFSVLNGSVGYEKDKPILQNINLTIDKNLAIVGDNGSGKTTLLKALCNDKNVYKTGIWNVPGKVQYLDQHYDILDKEKSAIEIITEVANNLSQSEIRKYLSAFLFRQNEICTIKSKYLSGGERARLCLAKICICPQELLILDEITNNIDLETRDHLITILKNYKNKYIIVSHDQDFLQQIGIQSFLDIQNFFIKE